MITSLITHLKTISFRRITGASLCLVMLFCASTVTHAERIKDLASIAGVRDNALLGYGLVVGLDGTGDQTSQVTFTEQSLRSMLVQYGVTVPPGIQLKPKNVAAVSIHAVLPPFSKPGQKIDVTLGVSGADGSSIAINVPSVGRIPNGATVERAVPNPFADTENVTFNLHEPDFTTARRMVDGINAALGNEEAYAMDAVSITVRAPMDVSQRVAFVGYLEELVIEPGESAGKIIVLSITSVPHQGIWLPYLKH